MYRTELLLLFSVVITRSYANTFSDDFTADQALCGYFGCTMEDDVGPLPPPNPLLKRPFCNGFRGCANGKRSLVVKTKTMADSSSDTGEKVEAEKRPFCNGFRGCANGKRSNVLDRDQIWFLQKLLENISRSHKRQASNFNSIGNLRRRRRASVKASTDRQS